jgi:hypothetical protein
MPSLNTVFKYFDEQGQPSDTPTTNKKAVAVNDNAPKTDLAAHLQAADVAASKGEIYQGGFNIPGPGSSSGFDITWKNKSVPNVPIADIRDIDVSKSADTDFEKGIEAANNYRLDEADALFKSALKKNAGRFSQDEIKKAITGNDRLRTALKKRGITEASLNPEVQ